MTTTQLIALLSTYAPDAEVFVTARSEVRTLRVDDVNLHKGGCWVVTDEGVVVCENAVYITTWD